MDPILMTSWASAKAAPKIKAIPKTATKNLPFFTILSLLYWFLTMRIWPHFQCRTVLSFIIFYFVKGKEGGTKKGPLGTDHGWVKGIFIDPFHSLHLY
jgi:hypothetical protein